MTGRDNFIVLPVSDEGGTPHARDLQMVVESFLNELGRKLPKQVLSHSLELPERTHQDQASKSVARGQVNCRSRSNGPAKCIDISEWEAETLSHEL